MAGRTVARGYGAEHKRMRAWWAPHVERGEVECARCHEPIEPGEPWDLGHDDEDRRYWTGPEHRYCNRSAPGLRRSAGESGPVTSRDW